MREMMVKLLAVLAITAGVGVVTAAPAEAVVTFRQFQRVKHGMTYARVTRILHDRGRQVRGNVGPREALVRYRTRTPGFPCYVTYRHRPRAWRVVSTFCVGGDDATRQARNS